MAVSKNKRKAGKFQGKRKAPVQTIKAKKPLAGESLNLKVEYSKFYKFRFKLFNLLMRFACWLIQCDAIETQFVKTKPKAD